MKKSELKELIKEEITNILNNDTAHYVPNEQGAGLDAILGTLEYIYEAGARGQKINLKQFATDIKAFFQK